MIQTGERLSGMYQDEKGATVLDYSGVIVGVEDTGETRTARRYRTSLRFSSGIERTFLTDINGRSDYTDKVYTCPTCGEVASAFAMRIHHQHDA